MRKWNGKIEDQPAKLDILRIWQWHTHIWCMGAVLKDRRDVDLSYSMPRRHNMVAVVTDGRSSGFMKTLEAGYAGYGWYVRFSTRMWTISFMRIRSTMWTRSNTNCLVGRKFRRCKLRGASRQRAALR